MVVIDLRLTNMEREMCVDYRVRSRERGCDDHRVNHTYGGGGLKQSGAFICSLFLALNLLL
ncbi:hypothetical protein HanRHA438_Chr09g0394751 [Helianthus annuus]|nr:hypothetical protein HanRHA438_Chr09g0394751 [Helianthus annuus]